MIMKFSNIIDVTFSLMNGKTSIYEYNEKLFNLKNENKKQKSKSHGTNK
jgi:hypothetical protein